MRERSQDVVLQHFNRGDDDALMSRHALPLETVARMCTLLDEFVRPGSTVLEVGTGIGYSALILAALAGPSGRVASVEVDPHVADATRRVLRHLRMAGRVHITTGDATLPGTTVLLSTHQENAPLS